MIVYKWRKGQIQLGGSAMVEYCTWKLANISSLCSGWWSAISTSGYYYIRVLYESGSWGLGVSGYRDTGGPEYQGTRRLTLASLTHTNTTHNTLPTTLHTKHTKRLSSWFSFILKFILIYSIITYILNYFTKIDSRI